MEKILLSIVCFIGVLFGLIENHESECSPPYGIGDCEVRDTSFALPRNILEEPVEFFKTLTDVQMIGRKWTDTYNYPEKLLYGDSIISEICRRILSSNKQHPVFIVEKINFGECLYYQFSINNREDSLYTAYQYTKEKVMQSPDLVTDTLQSLMDNWNVRDMFRLGGEDKVPYIEIEMEEVGIVHYGRPTGDKPSGCVIRLVCDRDSLYVDMVKLYLWPFDFYDRVREKEKIVFSR